MHDIAAKPQRHSTGHVRKAYDSWAPVYDLTFEWVMGEGRREAVRACRKGDEVLDVGVGTGLELPLFDPSIFVHGIDISEEMLQRAQERVERLKLQNIRELTLMDAEYLSFADASFDTVIAPYVMSVVPHPHAVLDQIYRVTRPGGQIILVNHFGTERGLWGKFESLLSKSSHLFGWKPDFPFAIIGDWLDLHKDVQLVERRLISPFGLFTVVRLIRQKTTESTSG